MKKQSAPLTQRQSQHHYISLQWYQERSRQAQVSFNVAVGLAAATAILTYILHL
jgi:hypothetical protein